MSRLFITRKDIKSVFVLLTHIKLAKRNNTSFFAFEWKRNGPYFGNFLLKHGPSWGSEWKNSARILKKLPVFWKLIVRTLKKIVRTLQISDISIFITHRISTKMLQRRFPQCRDRRTRVSADCPPRVRVRDFSKNPCPCPRFQKFSCPCPRPCPRFEDHSVVSKLVSVSPS